MGLSSYYRRFIKSFAKVAKPLAEKTSERVKYCWTEEIQIAFKILKAILAMTPFIAYPDHEKPFVVCTDPSSKVVGTVMFQMDDHGRESPIHYASRALTETEK